MRILASNWIYLVVFARLPPPAIEEDCLAEAIFNQAVASNWIKEMSHKNLNKNAAHIPRFR